MKQTLTLVVLLALVGCSSATPTSTPGVERMGETVLRYNGPEIEAALGYRYAAANLGEDWLIVDLAVTAVGDPVEIERTDIFVRTPKGETIPLATQQELAEEFSRLRGKINRAAIASDPLDYFKLRAPCALRLFSEPGRDIVFNAVTVDNRQVCSGRLFFAVPEGVQAGGWVLGIDLPESKVRIPFRLGEER